MPPRRRRAATSPDTQRSTGLAETIAETAETAETAEIRLPAAKKQRRGKPKSTQAFNEHDQCLSVRYSEKASHAGRKARDAQWLKKYFTDLLKRSKPTGDPDQPEEDDDYDESDEYEPEMDNLNDQVEVPRDTGRVSKDSNFLFHLTNRSSIQSAVKIVSSQSASTTPLPTVLQGASPVPIGLSVKRVRTTKASTPSQSKQALDQIFSSLKSSGTEIASTTQHLERFSMVQVLQAQLDRAEGKIEKLEEKLERQLDINGTLKDENREVKMRLMFADKFNNGALGGISGVDSFSGQFNSL